MKVLTTSDRIDAVRREWGARLLILGHHYQRAAVLRHADALGDSLELSRLAARSDAERIVFCGVRFMAESADILTRTGQTVYMPAMSAGCPMADMATAEAMERAWRILGRASDDWVPVVYVNSSAAVKACCGELGGSTCTSSNAAAVFRWVFGQGKRVFFLPDEHLGVNTAADLGLPDDQVLVFDPRREDGGLAPADAARARVVVWKGFCLVHTAFTVDHVRRVREAFPEARIIVHPETPREVVRLADAHGSTSRIIRYVEAAPPGTTIVIGTEQNLVERLAAEHAGRVTIKALAPSVCANMARTNEENLLEVLEDWPADRVVRVPEPVAASARRALERMLSL
jgi:quinolinate synthase